MVEAIANSCEEYLISGRSFKTNPGAGYMTNRRNITWYTSGAQNYISGQGAWVIRIDPSTVRLIYTLTNTARTGLTLRPVGGPWALFS